jgi:hypothetical protein
VKAIHKFFRDGYLDWALSQLSDEGSQTYIDFLWRFVRSVADIKSGQGLLIEKISR